MKIIILGLMAMASIVKGASIPIFDMDFIKGFDEGIKLKENDDPFEIFRCPPIEPTNKDPVKSLNTLWSSAKGVIGLIKQEDVEAIVKTTDVFIKSMGDLATIFIDYEGDEFCQGVIFGKDGSFMLVQIASRFAQLAEFAGNNNSNKNGNASILDKFITKGFNLGGMQFGQFKKMSNGEF